MKNIKSYGCVATMCSLAVNQQCFLIDLWSPPPPIPRAIQIQQDEGDSKLALRLAIAKYHIAGPKHEIGTLSRRYPINHSTLQRYNREIMMSGSQYKNVN